MIAISQLLESVDLDFEPRFVTKDKNGTICLFANRPTTWEFSWATRTIDESMAYISHIKLSDFADKPWTECIYEVPRKTTRKIELLKETTERVMLWKINELVDAVNELKGAKNE